MDKLELLIQYVDAIRESERQYLIVEDVLPGYTERLVEMNNDRFMWEDKVIFMLLNESDAASDYFFEAAYNGVNMSTIIATKALAMSVN